MARPRRPAEFDVDAGRRRHLPPGRASDRHPAADRRRAGEERARHDLRLGREPPLDRRAHHLSEFCRRRGGDRGLQRLRTFLRRRVDRRRRRVGRARAPARRAAACRALTPEQELAAKRKRARNAIPASAPHQPHFGLTLVSCERGDIRQSPDGLLVYSEQRPRGDRAAERQEPARSGDRGIRRRHRRQARRPTPAAGAWPISRSARRRSNPRAPARKSN